MFRIFNKPAHIWKLTAGTILIICGTILFAKESNNDIKRNVLEINRAVYENRWTDVLVSARHCSNLSPLVSCQTNLALFQSGILLDSLFAYAQPKGPFGLLMVQTWCLAWPEAASDVAWRLGLVNESLHWGHEALEHKGPTAVILNRLGMAYMMKGENDAANHFFLNSENVPFQSKIAENLIRLNENPAELMKDSTCNFIRSCMLTEDLISPDRISTAELELLLKRNPKNKMAFEYLIAYHLLNGNLKGIWDHIPDFVALNYSRIPRSVQEALIVITSMIPNFDLNKLKGWVKPATYNNFLEFRKIIFKHKDEKSSAGAKQELQARFGDTYWYYLTFVKPAPRQSESKNEYQ